MKLMALCIELRDIVFICQAEHASRPVIDCKSVTIKLRRESGNERHDIRRVVSSDR